MWPLENPAPADPARVPASTRPELVLVRAPARPRRTPGWRAIVQSRRRVACCLVVVAIVAGNAVVAHDVVSANGAAARLRAQQQQLQVQLEFRRGRVSALQASIEPATRGL